MQLPRGSILLAVAVVACLASSARAHTWLLDPPAHYQLFPRNAITATPCEPYSINSNPMKVKAGQEIQVTWAAMGHAGGYVRLALAPKWWMTFDLPDLNDGSGDGNDSIIFSSNVIKFDCFGGAECKNGDEEWCVDGVYGTKLVIPINLREGVYTLQLWATAIGKALPHSFSCSDIFISGGDDSITCDDMVMPAMNDTENGLDRCLSCREEFPHAPQCRPPNQVEGGWGFLFGKFCFPETPVVKKPKMELIGYAPHELGPGDSLAGIAKAFQCCCTPTEIAVTTGWGDVDNAIKNLATNYLIAGKNVIVPFYKNRRGCTPADPADFINGSQSRWPVAARLVALAVVLSTSLFLSWL